MELAWGCCCLYLFPLVASPRSVETHASEFSEELGSLARLEWEHLQVRPGERRRMASPYKRTRASGSNRVGARVNAILPAM